MKSTTFAVTVAALTIASTSQVLAQENPFSNLPTNLPTNLPSVNLDDLQSYASQASSAINSLAKDPSYSSAIAAASSAVNSYKSANGLPTGSVNTSGNSGSSVKPITAGILALSAAAAVGLL
ncbi:unnamed protein product [Cunninghamella blakesleeana]